MWPYPGGNDAPTQADAKRKRSASVLEETGEPVRYRPDSATWRTYCSSP